METSRRDLFVKLPALAGALTVTPMMKPQEPPVVQLAINGREVAEEVVKHLPQVLMRQRLL